MRKRILATVIMCCAIALAMGLAACGGSSSGSAASGSGSAASDPDSSSATASDSAASDSGSGSASSGSGSASSGSGSASSGSGSASSGSGSASSDDAQAKAKAEAKAALEEGIGYWYGTGANGYNKEKARAAFQKAADGGNAEGWYWLGKVMETDTNADRKAQVANYYQKAADGGCAKGYCGLAYLYRKGWGVEQDAAKAKELYEKAMGAGELTGNIGLGNLYQNGEGVEANAAKAIELFEQAAASDDWIARNAAYCSLGYLYRVGAEGLETDAAKAIEWYQKAANENYRSGWSGVGNMYSSNVVEGNADNEVNDAKKFECYSKAAELGDKYNLAICYEYGNGCEQDYAKEIELLTWDAENGINAAYAMKALGLLAYNGWGMEKNYDVAADWCHKAIDAAGPGEDYAVTKANEILDDIANAS